MRAQADTWALLFLGSTLAEASAPSGFVAPHPLAGKAPAVRLGAVNSRRSKRGVGDPMESVGLQRLGAVSGQPADTGGEASGTRRRRRRAAPAAAPASTRNTPTARVCVAAANNDDDDGTEGIFSPAAPGPSPRKHPRTSPPPPPDRTKTKTAFPAAAFFRGGGGSSSDNSSDGGAGGGSDGFRAAFLRPAVAAAVEGLHVGNARQNRLIIDHVEDALSRVWTGLAVVGLPALHLLRLGFGLSLLFYGMAFRTFAFHVIVFRLAGFKQVQRATNQLLTKYRTARKSIREAAEAAETVGERVIRGDELKAAREKMIKEKKRLLSNGYLSEEETRYFMKKYKTELLRIKEDQERFESARSSVLSLRSSVDPKVARSSISGMYGALVTCFTASTIQTAGQITLGIHIGSLMKTHVLDMFGPILDPIGYRLDLDTYFDKEDIPYMGKANAMDGSRNLALNILCYSVVFGIFRVKPSVALQASMVYYGARVVTDYIVLAIEPAHRKLRRMTVVHTPWSAAIHAGLTVLGYRFHRHVLHTVGIPGLHPLAVGPGVVGLVEPCVRFFVTLSGMLAHIEFFKCRFLDDPVEAVKTIASLGK